MVRLALLLILLADPIQDLVRQVSQSNYTHYLANLLYTRNGDSRGLGAAQHDAARENIRQTFERFGLTTTLHPFEWQGGTHQNVIAVLPGKVRPDEYHVLGAHYDSVAVAPGADDDASGVAAVLEAARVLSMQDLETSVVFIAFDREEQGLIGSRAWAAEHSADRIHSMISLDMIGFNPPGYTHDVVALCTASNAPNPTVPALANAVWTFGGGIVPVTGCTSTRSDHAPFADLAPSVLMIESAQNPHYHKATDSVDTPNYLDFAYAAAITRSAVGYLATYAGLLPLPEGAARLSGAGVANAASWVVGSAAPSQLLSLIGSGLTVDGAPASTVTITDAAGVDRPASLTYSSSRQLNLVLPGGLAPGAATITVARGDGVRVSAAIPVETTAPGFFTADQSGAGAAAAQAVRIAPDGSQTIQDLFACTTELVCASVPIDFGGESDRVVLVFYGTGLRGRADLAAVTAAIEGRTLPVEYAGPQPSYPGLDQVNLELPRELHGRGEVAVTFRVDGKPANPILINLGSTI